MTKSIEINYVGIEDVIALVNIANELQKYGDYCGVAFSNFGFDIEVHHMIGGWEIEKGYNVSASFNIDDENNPDPRNYEKLEWTMEKLLDRLDELQSKDKEVA